EMHTDSGMISTLNLDSMPYTTDASRHLSDEPFFLGKRYNGCLDINNYGYGTLSVQERMSNKISKKHSH
ncbi:hypothetical protein, partial [Segatella bryantii]|uniref:hypothetical protein n=1 Tax=Segatella bryantii TaxID=77095 RepID=UPI001C40A152